MIKLFRKIRQRLITANNVGSSEAGRRAGKYLLHAIGEIVIVVIGISIVLQVNTWNENRKRNIEEVIYLKRLSTDMAVSIEKTQFYTDFMLTTASRSTSILRNLDNCRKPNSERASFVNGLYHLGKLAPTVFVEARLMNFNQRVKYYRFQNVELREQLTSKMGVYQEFNVIFPKV